jgi:hypothetical protein
LVGGFFDFYLVGATSAAGSALSGNRRATACQIRTTANLRLVKLLHQFQVVEGPTPAKLLHVSTGRDAGHSAVSLASSLVVENACDPSALAGRAAWATMLFSESIVNVDIVLLLAFCCGRDIHHFHEKAKSSQDAVADFRYFFAARRVVTDVFNLPV